MTKKSTKRAVTQTSKQAPAKADTRKVRTRSASVAAKKSAAPSAKAVTRKQGQDGKKSKPAAAKSAPARPKRAEAKGGKAKQPSAAVARAPRPAAKNKAVPPTVSKKTPASQKPAKNSGASKRSTPKAAEKTPKTAPRPSKAAEQAKPKAQPQAQQQPRPKVKRAKLLPREFLFELAHAIRDAVVPVARSLRGGEIVSTSVSGDATFELDRIAEKTLLAFLRNARAPIAYYSEEAGYSTFSNVQPKYLLIVDPIDGTRAAKSGFESCVVAIGVTQVIERPRMADIESACVAEIFGDRTFYAERGGGARMYEGTQLRRPKPSQNTNLEHLTWAMTVPARPAELIFPTAARLIDLSSLKGGFFPCNSTSYSVTRLLTGQLDACVDFASRYMHDIPSIVRDKFINAGRGVVLGIAPYDLAAALLVAQEAGCVITNAYGESFDDVMLLDSSASNHQSLIAAANADLHAKLLNFFDTRIRQFETLLQRRN